MYRKLCKFCHNWTGTILYMVFIALVTWPIFHLAAHDRPYWALGLMLIAGFVIGSTINFLGFQHINHQFEDDIKELTDEHQKNIGTIRAAYQESLNYLFNVGKRATSEDKNDLPT